MKLKTAIESLGANSVTAIAKEIAISEAIDWEGGAKFVFSVIANDLERVPGNIGGKNDSEQDVIKKWLLKYRGGFVGRASKRVSNPPGTVADPIIEKIIGSRLDDLTDEDLNKMTFAHRLGMSAENILGLILEEYLSENLKEKGWHCAWGETVKSVDFVNEDGSLLQIKNRSNSENSSSSAVRDGTEIEKWYRIKADRVEYMWSQLNEICGTNNLSEDGFVNFVKKTLTSNPDCLAVENNNPWK
ncbi:MAG: SinI family restriction endonuclease [Gammaproteobacteria bacterium]|nr:SinI family restriction endonuclease [Gammaproteobacteria bacterium]